MEAISREVLDILTEIKGASLKSPNANDYLLMLLTGTLEELPFSLERRWILRVKVLNSISMEGHTSSHDLAEAFSRTLKAIFNLFSSENLAQMVRMYIDKNCNQDINIEDIAREFRVSPEHLSRSFAERFGTPPSSYLRRRRLERFADLIRSIDELPIKSLAEQAGFPSYRACLRATKQAFGTTPTDLRELLDLTQEDSRHVKKWRPGIKKRNRQRSTH